MSEHEHDERRLRRAAVTRFGTGPEDVNEPTRAPGVEGKADEDDNAASRRMEQQGLWVELQVRKAMERGDFDNLPGAGKPIDLSDQHDPNWWVKRLVERERISVAPPAIALRREDAELDDALDREWSEDGVRRVVDDFNRRVVEARRQLTGGPPVVTRLRETDVEVERWQARRAAAREAGRVRRAEEAARRDAQPRPPRRRWWRGGSGDV